MSDYTDPFGLVGQVLDGQYRVDRLVGEGGFSAVYQGRHIGLDEPIALKCMKIEMALGKEVVESFIHRFRDESRLLYRLSQGNLDIVRCMASGTAVSPATGTMVPYMVLEWLEGRSLAADLHVRREQGFHGRPLFEALSMLDSAADGLAYAHSQGVIHRDLNPGNLYIAQTRTGPRMKVLDFGVAKVVRDEVLALGPRAMTLANVRIFSPAYAAPEQFDERIGAVAPSTDVWSLAIILSEVITDRPVFEGDSLGAFFQKVLDPSYPRTPRQRGLSIGDAAEKVFQKALSMSPLARYPDVGTFWSELRLALSKDLGSSTLRGSNNPFQPSSMGTEVTQAARLEETGFDPSKLPPQPESTQVAPLPNVNLGAAFDATMRPAEAEAARAAFTDLKGTVRMTSPLAPQQQTQAMAAQPMQQQTQAMAAQPMQQPPAPPIQQQPYMGPPSGLFQGAPVAPPPNTIPVVTGSIASPLTLPAPQAQMPPPPEASQAVAVVPKSNAPLIIAIVIVVIVLGAIGAGVVLKMRQPADVTPTPSASTSATEAPSASTSAAPSTTPPPPSATVIVTATAEPSHTAAPTATLHPTNIAPHPTAVTNANAFDAKAARAALDLPASIIAACKDRGAVRGPGVANVTFSNDGKVMGVVLDGAYANAKDEGTCIATKLKSASMHPFDGPPQTIKYSFNIAR